MWTSSASSRVYCPEGSATPFPCVAGTYSNAGASAASECSTCPAGSFCPVGTGVPVECAEGQYCEAGSELGKDCVLARTSTFSAKSTSEEDCACKPGSYMRPEEATAEGVVPRECVECTTSNYTGVDCLSPGASLEALRIKPGYWRSHALSARVSQCFHAEYCVGTLNQNQTLGANTPTLNQTLDVNGTYVAEGSRSEVWSWSEGCAEHHMGPFCELCVAEHIMTADGCALCEGSIALAFVFPIAVVALAIVLAFYACCTGRARQIVDVAGEAANTAFDAGQGGDESMVEDAVGAVKDQAKEALQDQAKEAVQDQAEEAKAAVMKRTKSVREAAVQRSKSFREAAERRGCTPERIASAQVKFRILVSLIQVLSQLGVVFSIPYPSFYNDLVDGLGVLSLDFFDTMPLGCVLALDHDDYLLMRTLIPLAILLVSVVVGQRAPAGTRDKLLTVNFVLFYLLFPSNSANIFATFQCETLDDHPGAPSFLLIDKSVDCESPRHRAMMGYAVLMVLVYPIGIPAMYAYLLFVKHGKELWLLRELELKRAGIEKDARNAISLEKAKAVKEGQPPALSDASNEEVLPADVTAKMEQLQAEEEELREALPDMVQKLILGYELRTFYFELLDCARKLAIVCLPVFFQPSGSVSQLIFGLMVCFLTFGAYMVYAPYVDDSDDHLAQLCQVQIFFALVSSIALKYDLGTLADSRNMGALLSVLTILPLVFGVLLETDFVSLCSDAVSAIRSRLYRKPSQVVPNSSTASADPPIPESSPVVVEALDQ